MKKQDTQLTLSKIRNEGTDIKQSVVALIMDIQESTVSKMEKKPIESISIEKLQKYLNAIGGEVVLTLNVPGMQSIKIK